MHIAFITIKHTGQWLGDLEVIWIGQYPGSSIRQRKCRTIQFKPQGGWIGWMKEAQAWANESPGWMKQATGPIEIAPFWIEEVLG